MELDSKTLERALRGDRDSFHRIASECWGMVFVFVRQRVRDTEFARDLTQETFLTAYAKRETLRSEESFVSWVLTIASRKVIDYRRRQSVRSEVTLAENKDLEAASCDPRGGCPLTVEAETEEDADLLLWALDQLDDRYRAVLILRYWSGLTPAQIARLLQEPEGTIRNRVFRAHAQLRKRFKLGSDSANERPSAVTDDTRENRGLSPAQRGIEGAERRR